MDTVVYVQKQRSDHTAQMLMLIWTIAVRIWHNGIFLTLYIILWLHVYDTGKIKIYKHLHI